MSKDDRVDVREKSLKGLTLMSGMFGMYGLVVCCTQYLCWYISVVSSTDRSKAVVPVLVLLFVALWFTLRGDLLYVFPCVILFLCFSVL